MPTRAQQTPRWALLEKGFRPFFLLSALFAVLIVPLWIVVFSGGLFLGAYLTPMFWHAHEMVFGFSAAVIAGFLLTASSNWTKRETATGGLLLALCVLWLAGRVALLTASVLPTIVVLGINLLFLPALGATLARVLVRAANRRNYAFLVLIAALWFAQLSVHLGALGIFPAWQRTGALVGVDLVILVILLMGGRIIPLFTKNATQKESIGNNRRLDIATLASMALLTVFDALDLQNALGACFAASTALLALARARRWGAMHSLGEPLLWVLHLGYFFIPVGLGLRILSMLDLMTSSAALHALTTGAIGTLTLGMMARVTLGHTGRPLQAGRWLGLAFGLVIASALIRVAGGIMAGAWSTPTLHTAATFWTLAFAIYLARLGPALVRPRPDGRPG